MIYNYHTHTWRCGHAIGREEDYIKRAIACGIKFMGFSDHVPYVFPDGYESGYRVPANEIKCYIDELSQLREKYKSEIDIKIGFEMEYYPSHFDKMLRNVIDAGGEYLILGQHFIGEEHPGGRYTYSDTDNIEVLKEYVSVVTEAIESGVFTYVAHPDIIRFTGDVSFYKEEMRKICVASKACAVPLEINFLGIRDRRKYPNEVFWEIAGEEKAPVTFGFDAHDILSAYDADSLVVAKEIVNKYKLNYIGKPKLIDCTKLTIK